MLNMSGRLSLALFALICIKASSIDAAKFSCPVPYGFGPCVMDCQPGPGSNKQCSGRKMCCSNGCGFTCQDPVKEGHCPYCPICSLYLCPPVAGGCIKDSQCNGAEKCCPQPCQPNTCVSPQGPYEKPGTCPPVVYGGVTCIYRQYNLRVCSLDAECPGTQKCCPGTCSPNGCAAPLQPIVNPSSTAYPSSNANPSTAYPPSTAQPSSAQPPSTEYPPSTAKPATEYPPSTAKPATEYPPSTAKPATEYPPSTAKPATEYPPSTAQPSTPEQIVDLQSSTPCSEIE